ncbi:hypothetical protein C2U72_22675 [Prosthecomicrobium hirschii]|nr:hypothetical protein C2U72_22675 [Prosthecomicrobium hirschii]
MTMMKSLLLAATLALASVAAIGGSAPALAADTGGGRGGNGAGGTGDPGGNGGSGGSDGILRLGEPGNIPGGPGAVHRHPRPRPLPHLAARHVGDACPDRFVYERFGATYIYRCRDVIVDD